MVQIVLEFEILQFHMKKKYNFDLLSINHFVEIIFTLSCTVVDINLLQINCSQNFLLKMCKKNVQTFCNLQSWARTHVVLVIGLYELLDPTT
jgi:hypothetical protein